MQELKREILINKAKEPLENGTADRVLGWKAGEFDYDVTPAVFKSADELENGVGWATSAEQTFPNILLRKRRKAKTRFSCS